MSPSLAVFFFTCYSTILDDAFPRTPLSFYGNINSPFTELFFQFIVYVKSASVYRHGTSRSVLGQEESSGEENNTVDCKVLVQESRCGLCEQGLPQGI